MKHISPDIIREFAKFYCKDAATSDAELELYINDMTNSFIIWQSKVATKEIKFADEYKKKQVCGHLRLIK